MARYSIILLGNISFEIPIYNMITTIIFIKGDGFILCIQSLQ